MSKTSSLHSNVLKTMGDTNETTCSSSAQLKGNMHKLTPTLPLLVTLPGSFPKTAEKGTLEAMLLKFSQILESSSSSYEAWLSGEESPWAANSKIGLTETVLNERFLEKKIKSRIYFPAGVTHNAQWRMLEKAFQEVKSADVCYGHGGGSNTRCPVMHVNHVNF